jgi:uncharacterized membrane protein
MSTLKAFAVITVLICCDTAAAVASFQPLGLLEGGRDSVATAISGDGSTVVGTTTRNNWAFVWNRVDGMTTISALGGINDQGTQDAILWDVSADGSVAVGSSSTDHFGRLAVTWTKSSGLVPFDKSDGTGCCSRDNGHGVSDDGRMVVGSHQRGGNIWRPLVWRDEVLETPSDIPAGSQIWSVSADGSIMAGSQPGFIWSEDSGYLRLDLVPDTPTEPRRISPDGQTVVGAVWRPFGTRLTTREAFRWNALDGAVFLGFLEGFPSSFAFDVSADGKTIVGNLGGGIRRSAFVWDEQHGMRLLQEILEEDFDLNLAGWHLTDAKGISYDGRVIAGFGINPDGRTEAWIVTLPRVHSVDIEVKPGGAEPSNLNVDSRGAIAVAILTTDVFDANQVDATTVTFGPDGASIRHQHGHVEDIDADGDMDLIVHFLTQETGLSCGEVEVTMNGETFSGDLVIGTDEINTVGHQCGSVDQ